MTLGQERMFDQNLISKIINTICGIANIGPDADGFIFIGVADEKSDAERVKNLDNIEYIQVGNRYVVGVEREWTLAKMNEETYVEKILTEIRESELSEPLKSQVLTQVDYVQYKGLSAIRLRVPSQVSLSSVDDVYYTRENSSTIKIEGAKLGCKPTLQLKII